MTYHKQEIERLNTELLNYQEVAKPAALEAAEQKRKEAEPELSELTEPHAYERHLNKYLADAQAAADAGERDEPRCDCGRPTCPMLNGKLPTSVVNAGSIDQGIRIYQRDHVGSATVLSEARRDYMQTCADVKSILREAVGLIKQDQIPDADDEGASA